MHNLSSVYFVRHLYMYFRFFIPCIFYMYYNKNYQQMRLFVLCLYFLFLVFSLHVSGLHGPIIRGISSCCFYATIWFMQCFVDRLRASADWFVVPYMFRAFMSPSSGVFQAVVFMLLFGSCSALLIVCVRQRTGLWFPTCFGLS